MRSNRKKEWTCILCDHRYEEVSLGETCPRDGGVLLEAAVREKHKQDPLLGRCIDDRYQLIDVLGVGGFGTVYRCYDIARQTEFAFKTIIDHKVINQGEIRQRFLQEGRLMSQLKSDYVVTVYATGESDGTLYMVLELVRGLSLKQHLARKRRLSLTEAVSVISQILMALEHSHSAGLIHRDLKPSNILFTDLESSQLKLIDFGIAKSLNDPGENGPKTRTGLVIGTVQYMAPEQLRKDLAVGPQADIYATGILFYEILCGKTPFQGSQAEVAAGHLYQYPPSIDDEVNVPAEVEQWLQTVLAKEPHDRYPDALTTRLALTKAVTKDEALLNTTLPIADDTVRMTPDVLFMQSFGGNAPIVQTEIDDSKKSNLVSDSVESPEHLVVSDSADVSGPTPTTALPKNVRISDGSALLSTLEQARKKDLEDILRDHTQDVDLTTDHDPIEPQATQKLTSLQLLRAAQQSNKPSSVTATDKADVADKSIPMSGHTALEDLPEALLGYGPPPVKDKEPGLDRMTLESGTTPVSKDAPIVQAETVTPRTPPASQRHESHDSLFSTDHKAPAFTKGSPETTNQRSDSLFSGLTIWLVIPLALMAVVAVCAVYLW